jgi:hypothetical protein
MQLKEFPLRLVDIATPLRIYNDSKLLVDFIQLLTVLP